MKQIELWRWHITDDRTSRPRLTRHHMTAADAQARHPSATPEPSSREVRPVPESPGEWMRPAQVRCTIPGRRRHIELRA